MQKAIIIQNIDRMFLFERCGPYLVIIKQKVKPDTIQR